MSRRLSSVQILRLGGQALIGVVTQLNEQLLALRMELTPTIMLGKSLNPNRLSKGLNLQQAVYLHCLYYTTELDIHNTLTYPWSQRLLGSQPDPYVGTQVAVTIDKVISSCHTAMLTLNYVHIDAATPVP